MSPSLLTDAALVLSALHTVGAALGAGAVTFAELFYLKDIADGKLTECEKRHIRATFFALRFGMSILLLSGIGLIIVEYFLPASPQHVLFAPFWMVNTLTIGIILLGYLLSRNLIPLAIGGSAALSAWWMILILDGWRGPSPDYFTFPIIYIIGTALAALVLALVRGFLRAHPHI